jgi:serine/threonine protein kinase
MAITPKQFWDALSNSGLLSEAEMATLQPASAEAPDGAIIAAELVNQHKLTPYQASVLSQGQAGGLVFGEYTVLEKLGEGGMGVVYKAQHRRLKRIVAVKVLNPALTKDEHLLKRFHREVEAAARLNHANIVAAVDANEQDGVHYLVMEFVDGPDLARLVKERGPLPVPRAVDYIVQAAGGLAHAHAKGLVHRDIKPSNLLLDGDGTVKILDMGLVRFTDAQATGSARTAAEGLTHTGHIMGTFEFMAPEQAVDTRRADERSDIYSLGCTLYYLLNGEAPYAGDTSMQKLLAHRDDPIPSLRAARPEVPLALNVIFQRMLAKRPEDRYASMIEVRRALKAIDRKSGSARRRGRPTRRAETLSQPPSAMTDSAIVPSIARDVSRPSGLGVRILGGLLVVAALFAVIPITAMLFAPPPDLREQMRHGAPFLYVVAAALFALGLRLATGGPLDVPFLGTYGGAVVGALAGVGAGLFFDEMSKRDPFGAFVGVGVGIAAGLILRLRWVGTGVCGLAAGAAGYYLGDHQGSLLGPLGFAPIGAMIGAVLAHRRINEQLKGGDQRGFWEPP